MYNRKVDKPLFLYGAGKLGQLAVEVMNELAIMISGIVDKNGLIKSKDILPEVKKKSLIAVCCTTEPYWKIEDDLNEAGWADIVSIYDIFNAYPECGITNGWTGEYNEQIVLRRIALGWDDGWSYEHYFQFLCWRCFRDELFALKWAPIISDSAIVGGRKIISVTKNSSLAAIRERRRVVQFGHMPFYDIHLEGMELTSIQQSIVAFQNHRPILKVACYHNEDGLWKIEKFLMDNLQRYKFYFRLHAYQGQAAYIYCIPEEKVKE
jgi:hypothetical protein